MNLSGIVVAVPPTQLNEGIKALNALRNLEVHQSDPSTGQIVVVQEADNISQEVDSLKKIKALPMVIYAEMVYHYLAEDTQTLIYPEDDVDSTNFDETLRKLNS